MSCPRMGGTSCRDTLAYSFQGQRATSTVASRAVSLCLMTTWRPRSSSRPFAEYRNVAELRRIDQGLRELPWWKGARNLDEIVAPTRTLRAEVEPDLQTPH